MFIIRNCHIFESHKNDLGRQNDHEPVLDTLSRLTDKGQRGVSQATRVESTRDGVFGTCSTRDGRFGTRPWEQEYGDDKKDYVCKKGFLWCVPLPLAISHDSLPKRRVTPPPSRTPLEYLGQDSDTDDEFEDDELVEKRNQVGQDMQSDMVKKRKSCHIPAQIKTRRVTW
jgi:hypothetical protein